MKKYTIEYTKNDKKKTVTVQAENIGEAMDDIPSDAEDVDVLDISKVEDEKNSPSDDNDDKSGGGASGGGGKESGGEDDGDDEVEIISVEEVEDEGTGKNGEVESSKDGKEDDSDEIEPQPEHPWFRDRSFRKKK